MMRRWIGSAGILAVMLWVVAGCSSPAPKEPIVAAAGMKTVTLSVKGMH